jgi:hypothetical protein
MKNDFVNQTAMIGTGRRTSPGNRPRHRLDEARFARVIVERCPQLPDRRSNDAYERSSVEV